MHILDPNGYLTEARIPLIALQELIEQHAFTTTGEQLLAHIKFANLYLLDQHTDSIDYKTREYFHKLKALGILGFEHLTDNTLLYDFKGQCSKLIGVKMPDGRIYYLHIMTADKRINQTLNVLTEENPRPISSLTGICMFGSGTDYALTTGGNSLAVSQVGGLLPEIPDEHIKDILIKPQVSLYETYKIKQFTAFLNTFIHTCSRGFGDAYLITPADQYPLYLLPTFIEGKISRQTFQHWVHESTKRSEALYRLFAKRMNVPLLLVPSPLKSVTGYLHREVGAGRIPELDKTLQILGNEDAYWQILLSDSESVPHNWRDLKLLSYVRGVIEAAIDSERKGNVLATVDDIAEKPMANSYTKIRRRLKQQKKAELPTLLGLYTPVGVVAQDVANNSYLYGHTHPSGNEFRTIFKTYRAN
jgi:hypothetical protein